jgi:uncharacterized ferredoxin-like protein
MRALLLVLLFLSSSSLSGCSNLGKDLPLGGKCDEVLAALEDVKDLAMSIEGKKIVNYLLYEIDKAESSRSIESTIAVLDKYSSGDVGGDANFEMIQELKGNLFSISQFLDGTDLFKLVDLGVAYRSNAAEVANLCQSTP